jgi:hypothetical protein
MALQEAGWLIREMRGSSKEARWVIREARGSKKAR